MSNVTFSDVKTNNIKFNKINDNIVGTLVQVGKTTSKDQYGKYAMIYTIKADSGEYLGTTKNLETNKFELDKETTKVVPGEEYTWFVPEDKSVITSVMSRVQIGQKLRVFLHEFKETQKGNDAKIIKVQPGFVVDKDGKQTPAMDSEFVESQKVEEVAPDLEGVNF
jgi:hypothetical protein